MRTKNSIKNILMNFLSNGLNYGLRFVSRIVFVRILSEVYLGVNGLLSNVLGLLSLTELGIGSAIGFSLYKPLADNDEKKITSLMHFYQKAYRIIFIIVLFLGLVLLPFLPFFIKDTSGIEQLNIIYLIFLFNMVISYLFSYKRTLILADQKNYQIMPIIMIFSIITTVFQIIVLIIFKNYIIYLLVQSICTVLEHIFVNYYINHRYPYLSKLKTASKLDNQELNVIKVNVKSLMLHKIGTYIVTSTDNLVISKFIGVITVGLYSNYCLITNMISSFIQTIIGNIIAGFGNLIASEKPNKRLKVFKEMNFICYILYGITSICLLNLLTMFIDYVFGTKFVLPIGTLYFIVLNYYLTGINSAPNMVQSASGLYRIDRYAPLIQSIINLVVSIVLAIKIGLIGVFIGTTVCMIIPLIIKPLIIYKYIFESSPWPYFKELFKETIILLIAFIISNQIILLINLKSFIINFIIKGIISTLVFMIFIIVFYYHSEEFYDIKIRTKSLIKRSRGI